MKQEYLDDVTMMLDRKRHGVIDVKRPQYSGDGDVLANFRRRAKTLHTTPEAVIISDASKHFDALALAINNGTFDGEWTTGDGAEGCLQKIGDLINLAELLGGCAVEKQRARASKDALRDALRTEFTIKPEFEKIKRFQEALARSRASDRNNDE